MVIFFYHELKLLSSLPQTKFIKLMDGFMIFDYHIAFIHLCIKFIEI